MSLADPDIALPTRILFNGVTGTGKTTAALRLAKATGLPFHSADDEFGWLPAAEAPWTNRSDEDMHTLVSAMAKEDAWVLDSAYGSFYPSVLPRTQLIIALDYPQWTSLYRLVKRTFRRAVDKVPVCNGNTESWRQTFSRDSIILWNFRSFRRKHERMMSWAADPDAPPVLIFNRPRDFEAWLRAIEQGHRRERGAWHEKRTPRD